MQKSVRQSMAWLHSWVGLLIGWFLFCIFLTGSTAYYRHEINTWSQPALSNIEIKQKQSIINALAYLDQNATHATNWYIQVANEHNPVNKVFWKNEDGKSERKTLDPNTNKELKISENQAGEFFYLFHFQLHGMPILLARTIVSFCAFIMLIALISGIITHKKIFADFFTLRAFKGQRSYLDFHNVTSVLALPFFLTVTFTGLAIFFYLYFPMGINKVYPENKFQFFDEIRNVQTVENPDLTKQKMMPIKDMLEIKQKYLANHEIGTINIKNPNTASATASFTSLEDRTITLNAEQVTFNAITGKTQPTTKNQSAIATLSSGVYGIHMAIFAQPFLRLAMFFSGILGCLMIASGLLLWSLKRQLQNQSSNFNFGHYLVDRLNITALIGLPIAMLSFLTMNRLILLFNFKLTEIFIFFSSWLFAFLCSLFIPKKYLWKTFLKCFVILGLALIILDITYLTIFLEKTASFYFWQFVRIDLFIFIFVLSALFLHQKVEPIKNKATAKIKKKINQPVQYNGAIE